MTIKDIAKMAGVSVSTVSRVLNDHPDVSAAIRAQVLKVVEEQHFIPNSAARNLVRPRQHTIGIICRETGNPFLSHILGFLEEELLNQGWSPCFRHVPTGVDGVVYAARTVRSEQLQGIIFLGGRADYRPEEISLIQVPHLCATFRFASQSAGEDKYSSVQVDEVAAARTLVHKLAELGHREMLMVAGDPHDQSVHQQRTEGWRLAQAELGLPVRESQLVACPGGQSIEEAYKGVLDRVRSGEPFTAVLAANDTLALAAVKALLDSGRRVPEDCSVAAVNCMAETAYIYPSVSGMVQPAEELARKSVQILLELVEGTGSNRHLRLESSFRPGQSLAKCGAGEF